jgi:hypothetical protein
MGGRSDQLSVISDQKEGAARIELKRGDAKGAEGRWSWGLMGGEGQMGWQGWAGGWILS